MPSGMKLNETISLRVRTDKVRLLECTDLKAFKIFSLVLDDLQN